MKVYISADIEGVSGVVDKSHTSKDGYDYGRARKLMTEEVNAAIRGAIQGGADEIVINDSHGPMTNLILEDIHKDHDTSIWLITGHQKHLGMMEGINDTYDAAVFIGYHARQNTSGVLSHTYSGRTISEIKLDGIPVGEFEFNSYIAGAYGVPVVCVSGDDILKEQVQDFQPNTVYAEVKVAISRYTARCMPPAVAHNMIKGCTKVGLEMKNSIPPKKKENEVVLEVTFKDSGMAENAMLLPNLEQISPNQVQYVAKDIIEAYKVRAVLIALASA